MGVFRAVCARWNDRRGDIRSPIYYLDRFLLPFLAWVFLGKPMAR